MRIALATLLAALAAVISLGWSAAPASAGGYTSGRFPLEVDGG
jgi:Spy/CpxP family protein refolding chaperone